MKQDSANERLWCSVKLVVSALKDNRSKGLGTAFVCGQNGATSYLLTCWHVVETIGADNLCVMGRKAKVVAVGDKALDLALLAVENLPETEILRLSDVGHADRPFRTIGWFWADEKKQDDPSSRPLDGRLGEERRKFSESYGSVAGWEFSIDKDDAFDRIRAGYSGAPVFDPTTGLVVAVISHQEGNMLGHAVAVSNLTIIYPPAEVFFDHSQADEGGGRDPWIVKTLDHKQVTPLRDRLLASDSPTVAVVEGCVDDWPKYLADDVFLHPWPSLDDIPEDATTLCPTRYGEGEGAFWSAAHHCVLRQAVEPEQAREAVRNWLRARDRHLFCISVGMTDEGLHLPSLIRAAQGFLAELSRYEPGIHLLMLIICQPPHERPPWWWPLWRGYVRRRLSDVLWLPPLRPLVRQDLSDWHYEFPSEIRRTLDRDWLLNDLLDLFQKEHTGIRYRLIRRRLLEGGALDKARIRP